MFLVIFCTVWNHFSVFGADLLNNGEPEQSDRPKWQHQLCRRPIPVSRAKGWGWWWWCGGGGGWEREHLSAWWRHPAPACLKPSPVRNPPPARPHRPGGWIQTLWFGLSNPSRILNQLTKIISEHPGSWKRTLKTDSSRRNSFFFLFFIPAEMSFCPAWKDLRGGEERRRGMDPGGDNATRRRAAPCFTADIDALQIETIHSCFISNDVFWEEAAFVRKIDGCKLHRTTYSYWEW